MDQRIKEKIQKRQEANLEILKHLTEIVMQYPELRFGQILSNYILSGEDAFYEESVDTLVKFMNKINNIK